MARCLFLAACAKSPVLYRPRDPQASDLWLLIDEHFDSFQQIYNERYQAKYGFWRPVTGTAAQRWSIRCPPFSSAGISRVEVIRDGISRAVNYLSEQNT